MKKVKKVFLVLLRMSLVPYFFREILQRKKVTIILYHSIKPPLADLHFKVLREKYNIISLRDYVASRTSKNRGDRLPAKPLIVTFDDGHQSNYDLLPIFKRHNIPAVIFLCSGI